MRNQFVVPQFLDVEPKIIGPITLRQFLIMVAVIVSDFDWRTYCRIRGVVCFWKGERTSVSFYYFEHDSIYKKAHAPRVG